jgi:dTDP-glucose 4,6-dehydratase
MHLAAESHVDRSIDAPLDFVNTNVGGTCELLEAVRGYWQQLPLDEKDRFRFVQVSTDEVYGSLGPTGAFTEVSCYLPNSPYSASKAAADHFVRAYHHTYGLPTLTTHCSNNYGPFQFPDKFIPLMILNALSGRILPVYGDGQNARDWLFVEDHAAALCEILERGRPGEVYNVGGNCEHTNLEVVHRLCAIIERLKPDLPHRPCKQLVQFVPDRPGHDRRYALDNSKVMREIGWRPRQDFESGLELTVRWYLENSDWVQSISDGTHQRRGLMGKQNGS